jgi:hypothetical protein
MSSALTSQLRYQQNRNTVKSVVLSVNKTDCLHDSVDFAFTVTANPDVSIAEKFVIIASVPLGIIERGVGLLNQRFQVCRIFRIDGDTDAGG